VLGLVFLLLSSSATLLLVLEHLVGLALPGCGPGSACAQAAASVWGKVPGLKWPVSHVGFAYFLGLLAAWIGARRGVSSVLRDIVRLGAIVSLLYMFVIIFGKYGCKYCLAAHAGNFAFWLVVETAGAAGPRSWRPAVHVGAVFVLATGILAAAETRQKEAVAAKGEKDLAESTAAIIAKTSQDASIAQAASRPDASPKPTPPIGPVAVSSSRPTTRTEGDRPWQGCFAGRHVRGPAKAPIRLVIISDYQCPDCQRTEAEVRELMARRDDISLAAKHFPMCKDCNPLVSRTLHGNACWAALAAETAGILRGEEGFWQMHQWLFDHKGMFTAPELSAALLQMGYDPAEFTRIMEGQAARDLVAQDIKEAHWLGVHYTPMVFINGVELKGVFAPNAVVRAIEALSAQNPPALGCEVDQPPAAGEKYVSDWRDQPVRDIPRSAYVYAQGPEEAGLQIIVWGDYQEVYTVRADAAIRRYIADKPNVRYWFRQYPIHQACNPYSQLAQGIQGCTMAKAAMAAGIIGGAEAFWKVHEWLMAQGADFSEEALAQAATGMGLDGTRLRQTMSMPATQQAVFEDIQGGRRMNVTQVPTIYVNSKFVPRWVREGDNVLERILDEASGQGPGGGR